MTTGRCLSRGSLGNGLCVLVQLDGFSQSLTDHLRRARTWGVMLCACVTYTDAADVGTEDEEDAPTTSS